MAARYAILFSAALLVADAARVVEITSSGFPRTIVASDLNDAVQIDDGGVLVAKREALTAAGTRKVRYEQKHLGIPVYGAVVTAEHDRTGALTGRWRGQVVADIEVDSPNAAVQPVEAFMVLRRAFGHDLIDPSIVVLSNEQAVLQIYVDAASVAHLAYLTSYVIEQSDAAATDDERLIGIPARPFGFVDAKTGELLAKWDGMSHDVETTLSAVGGNTCGAGKRIHTPMKITRLTDGVTCKLATSRVQVQNMKGKKIALFSASTFPCSQVLSETYDFINGGYSACNDALYYTELVYDMFVNYTGHAGPLNRAAPLKARVHYGSRYENAFWDGTYMTIGDGDTFFCPLTASDIIAHEYAHGFTEFNSNLQYQYMSGGMNEAFSDMAGEALKFFRAGTNDFLVGAEVMKSGGALRYMCTPSRDGKSIESANSYTSSMDVHYTSGVYNKAFCCLAKTAGWDTGKAFKVFARANDLYWSSTSTFNAGACGVQTAATDLAYRVQDVVSCFASVQVACTA